MTLICVLKAHCDWIKDIQSFGNIQGPGFPYPIIDDADRQLAHKLGMIDPDEVDSKGMALTARAVFVIGME